jgi:hypothetical protein
MRPGVRAAHRPCPGERVNAGRRPGRRPATRASSTSTRVLRESQVDRRCSTSSTRSRRPGAGQERIREIAALLVIERLRA